jgi:MFS family permease
MVSWLQRQRPDFLKLWAGETVSLVGSEVTILALPLTALLTLHASATEIGVLNAAKFAPWVLLALPAGVWVDRARRRRVMVATNLAAAAVIGSVPLLAAFGALSVPYLVGVALVAGALAVVGDVAFWTYVPTLVEPERLLDANSKLLASTSAASIGGPGLGGLLVQLLSAAGALVLDAASFVAAALSLAWIRKPEPVPERRPARSLRTEVAEGLAFVLRNPYLRAFAGEAAVFNLFVNMLMTAFLVYAVRELELSAGAIGAVIACGAAGILVGSLVADWFGRRMPLGRAILVTMFLGTWPYLLVPLGARSGALSLAVMATGFSAAGVGIGIVVVLVVTLRQSVTPPEMMGRMTASYRFVVYGTIAAGALLGGVLGSVIGLRPTILVGAVGIALAPIFIVLSPIGGLRSAEEAKGGELLAATA